MYDDTSTAWRIADPVDIVVSGFPCQPFSVAGDLLALNDSRGLCIVHILKYLQRTMPRIVILENVPGLRTHNPEILVAILESLKNIRDARGDKYATYWKVMSSREYGGVPHSRDRLYIVAIKRCFRDSIEFTWPTQIPCSPLSQIWDADRVPLRSYRKYPIPQTLVAAKCVKHALHKILDKAEQQDKKPESYDVIIDCGTSSASIGWDCCPTLTRTRCLSLDYWSIRHASRLSVAEIARLQGFPSNVVLPDCVTPNQWAGMLGDAFTIPVVVRILASAVNAAET